MRNTLATPCVAAWLALLALPGLAACGGCNQAGSAGDAGPDHGLAPATSSPTTTSALPPGSAPTPPPRLPCRVVFATPSVAIEDAGILATAAEVPDGFVDLPAAGRFTAKDPRSTRETNFAGPGRVRACVGHEEEAWVGSGDFASAPGSGERPGGEQWVITPLGVVMYAAEDVKVHVRAGEVDIDSRGPNARVWLLDGVVAASPAGALHAIDVWASMAAQHATLKPAKPGADTDLTNAFVARCGSAADDAEALATDIAHAAQPRPLGGPDASLGDLAGRHVKARQIAHAACRVAALRVSSMPPSPQRDAWKTSVDAAEARWHEVSPRD